MSSGERPGCHSVPSSAPPARSQLGLSAPNIGSADGRSPAAGGGVCLAHYQVSVYCTCSNNSPWRDEQMLSDPRERGHKRFLDLRHHISPVLAGSWHWGLRGWKRKATRGRGTGGPLKEEEDWGVPWGGTWAQSGWEMGARLSLWRRTRAFVQLEGNSRFQTLHLLGPAKAARLSAKTRLYSRRTCFSEVSDEGVGLRRPETQGNSVNCAFRFLIVKRAGVTSLPLGCNLPAPEVSSTCLLDPCPQTRGSAPPLPHL